MKLSSKALLIVANPFAAPLAPDGAATALCTVDPTEPMGGLYINARTVAKAVKRSPEEEKRRKSPIGPRDKVSVVYTLKPVSVADTSHYRGKIKSGEAFEAPASDALHRAARAALVAFVREGGNRDKALARWREQGLSEFADALASPSIKSTSPVPASTPIDEGAVS